PNKWCNAHNLDIRIGTRHILAIAECAFHFLNVCQCTYTKQIQIPTGIHLQFHKLRWRMLESGQMLNFCYHIRGRETIEVKTTNWEDLKLRVSSYLRFFLSCICRYHFFPPLTFLS